jgi:hypothetical protein
VIPATVLHLEAERVLIEFAEQTAVPLIVGETVVFESNQEVIGRARVFSQLDRHKGAAGQQDSWGGVSHER